MAVAVTLMSLLWQGGSGVQAKSPYSRRADSVQHKAQPQYGFDNLSAQSWLLIEARTGRVLSSKSPDSVMYPASITKIMTCVLAIESGRLNDTITITPKAARTESTTVQAGYTFRLRDLLDEMMLESDNGAAQAVADYLSTDERPFITQMNAKAKQLGMKNTHYANPHGLPNTNNYSTASDIMRLVQYAMSNRTFAAIVGSYEKTVPLIYPQGKVMRCRSTNKLLTRYEGANGVKTGYIRAAGGCLASAAKRNGIQLYLVLLKCSPVRARFDESAFLLDYGFDRARYISTIDTNPSIPYPKVRRPRNNSVIVPLPRKGKSRR